MSRLALCDLHDHMDEQISFGFPQGAHVAVLYFLPLMLTDGLITFKKKIKNEKTNTRGCVCLCR